MTIASEIERLQEAKADIKSSIEWKWVSVPSSAKLDEYPELINQIRTDVGYGLFVPQSLVISDAVHNRDRSVRVSENIFDIISPDWNTYYHYFWFRNSDSTAYDSWCVWAFKKTKLVNPTFNYWELLSERNMYYNAVDRNVNSRMKFEDGHVKASTLAFRQYDSNGRQTHGGKTTATLYCVNIVDDTIWWIVTLWSVSDLDDEYYYNYTIIPNWNELRTASCWITQEESIGSVWLTSMSFSRGSSSSNFDLTATLIV